MNININGTNMEILVNEKFENALVPLSAVEREKLREMIVANGGLDPAISKILLWQPNSNENKAYIIEGHNRYHICEEEGFELTEDCFDFSEPFEDEEAVIRWIEDNQLGRRNISKYARFEIIYRRDGEKLVAEGKKRMSEGGKGSAMFVNPSDSKKKRFRVDECLAPIIGVSGRSIQVYLRIYRKYMELVDSGELTDGIRELMIKLRTGDISANEAVKALFPKKEKEPGEEQTPEEDEPQIQTDDDKDQIIADLKAQLVTANKLKEEAENRVREFYTDAQAAREECKSAKEELNSFRKSVMERIAQYGLKLDDNGEIVSFEAPVNEIPVVSVEEAEIVMEEAIDPADTEETIAENTEGEVQISAVEGTETLSEEELDIKKEFEYYYGQLTSESKSNFKRFLDGKKIRELSSGELQTARMVIKDMIKKQGYVA